MTQLQRLIITFKPEETIMHALYRTQDGPGPNTKARRREVEELTREGLRQALASLGGETTLVGCSGFTQRQDVLLADTREEGSVAGLRVLVSNNVPTTGSAPVVSHMMGGHASAIGYAEQIRSIESIRLESAFADGIRGLHLYGAKLLDPARLFVLQGNP
jgi:hypothetical protein